MQGISGKLSEGGPGPPFPTLGLTALELSYPARLPIPILLTGVVGRANPTLHGSPEHFLQLYSVEATHSHLEKPVCPKHPWYPKVVQAARHVAERGPIQEESVIFPIHYERPSACLQKRLCSAKVWSGGSVSVEEMELALPTVL